MKNLSKCVVIDNVVLLLPPRCLLVVTELPFKFFSGPLVLLSNVRCCILVSICSLTVSVLSLSVWLWERDNDDFCTFDFTVCTFWFVAGI